MSRVQPPGGGPKQRDGSGARTPAPRQRRSAPGRVRTVFACCGFSLAAATLATLVWSTLAIDALHAQHGGAAGGAAALSVTPHGPADPPYGTAPGFWSLDTNHTFPVPGLLARARFATHGRGNSSCLALAAAQEEPFSEAYAPRGAPPQPLPGDTPRVAWRWEGRIPRSLFESVPFILRDRHGCHHCTYVLRYKVLGGRLFADAARRRRDLSGQVEDAEVIEEVMLAALHMFKVPDADLLVHVGDGAPEGLPLLQPNIDRGFARAGFAIPARRAWPEALGPSQLASYISCLEVRYPRTPGSRSRRAVWRGSNTDRAIDPMEEGNALDAARSRLHLFGRWYPHLFDAHITDYAQRAFDTQCVDAVMPPGGRLPLEDVNRYMLALDIDGNGWSDRLRVLALSNTPVLKQATNLSSFWDHLLPPTTALEYYAPDLHDLPVRAAALLAEAEANPARLWAATERRQGIASLALNQVAVIQAMAYAMTQAASLSDWTPKAEPGYEPVPFARCCRHAPALPRAFIEAVRSTGRARGEGARGSSTGSGGATATE